MDDLSPMAIKASADSDTRRSADTKTAITTAVILLLVSLPAASRGQFFDHSRSCGHPRLSFAAHSNSMRGPRAATNRKRSRGHTCSLCDRELDPPCLGKERPCDACALTKPREVVASERVFVEFSRQAAPECLGRHLEALHTAQEDSRAQPF